MKLNFNKRSFESVFSFIAHKCLEASQALFEKWSDSCNRWPLVQIAEQRPIANC